MRELRFSIQASSYALRRRTDTAYLSDGEDVLEALRDAMWNAVHLDVEVTIGDTTAPAMMWEDPEHWAEDWTEKLGVEYDEVPEAVAGIFAEAISEER